MAEYNKINKFVQDLAHMIHDLETDQLVVALVSSPAPVATNSVLADLTQIAYTNLSSRNITTTSSAHTTGTYKLTLTDLVLTASGAVASFQYVVIYNDTPTTGSRGVEDPLIAWYNHGSSVTLANGETFTIDFSDANGFLQIA
jgi:hypothetical protein